MSAKKKFFDSFAMAFPSTLRSAVWLLRLMIPISLVVTLLQYYGILDLIAGYLQPLFCHIGLPGASAVVFISGAAAGTYAGIAAMMAIPLTFKQATILSLMIALCHNLPVECAVNRSTGSSFRRMAILRLVAAFICAFLFNIILPDSADPFIYLGVEQNASFSQMILAWIISQLKMSALVFLIIYVLMVIQRMIEAFSLLQPISRFFSPIMRLFGLPDHAAYMWLVGNVIGLGYGSAVMLELEEKGLVTPQEANDVNYHLIMNHSLLEDTIVFAAIGISAPILVATRVGAALVVVWTRRAYKALKKSEPTF